VSDFEKQEKDIYSKRTLLLNALSTTLGQTLANLLRVYPGTSNCIIISKREKFIAKFSLNNSRETLANLLRVHPGISNSIIIYKRKKFL